MSSFSTPREWHAFAHGMYAGLRSLGPWATSLPAIPEVEREPHYYKGGYIAGTVLQLFVIGMVLHLI